MIKGKNTREQTETVFTSASSKNKSRSSVVHLVSCRESLIRTAFQCLQLVVTDFLPTMPCTCLQIVVDVAGSFGLQNQELNISLTSIGLLVRECVWYSYIQV